MNRKILVIEDEASDQYLLQRIFKKLEVKSRITFCLDGLEAFDYLESCGSTPPSLIFLDINTPGLSSFEFLEGLYGSNKRNIDTTSIAIVVLTSSEYTIDKERLRKYPAVVDYLVKPAEIKKIKSILENYSK